MTAFITGTLTHTPIWVWVLFVFLIARGIKARKPATVTLEKLAIIPAIFLIWDIYDLVMHRHITVANCALWVAGILVGAALGYLLIKQVATTRATEPRSIHRQADYSALPFMMLAFLVKYVLGVMTAISPERLQQPTISAFAILSGGLFAGVFIGKFTRYVRVYLSGTPQRAG